MTRTTILAATTAVLSGLMVCGSPSAQGKTLQECSAQWSANQAALQAAGKSQRAFMAECRGLPLSAPTPKARAPRATRHFATEAEARLSCPFDTVVWVNLHLRIYHFSGSPAYGKARHGAFMCEKDVAAAGYRAARPKRI